ncbi:MAG: phosphonate ABC transporter ATP-binding protein [Neptuniibacter sp.]
MSRSIHISELNKTFGQGKKAHQALKSVSFDVEAGEMVALIGASGSGKSTLMRHISGLTAADKIGGAGLIEVLGRKVQHNGKLYRGKRHERANTASIFQQFNLISRLSVLTNVCLGLLGRIPSVRGTFGVFTHEEKMAAMKALDRVGMAKYADQRASTLSGGQQQRVAIARALVQQAQVILADEPIASLDPASSKRVMQALSEINAQGISVIVSLHQVSYATKYCPRTIAMRDGEIVFDGESTALTPEFLTELYGEDSEELILGRKYTTADEDEFEFDEALSASAAG